MTIGFQSFEEAHLAMLRRWLKEPHVSPYWRETEDEVALKAKFIDELPRQGVHAFVTVTDGRVIGFIQYYEACKVGGGWWSDEKPGTFGLDLMIGEPSAVGHGLGAVIVREFIEFMRDREPRMTSVLIDPDPKNERAIRAFERAGFRRDGETVTPDGPALLMRIRF